MRSLNEKVDSSKPVDLNMRIGDWELDTSDPLSPGYEPSIKDICFGMLYVSVFYMKKLFKRS